MISNYNINFEAKILKNKVKYTMSSMKISPSDLDHIAKLARIELSQNEKEVFLPQLESILDYFDVLNKVNIDGVAPTYRVNEQNNVSRQDIIKESFSQKESLSTASKTKNGYFVVPGTIKK